MIRSTTDFCEATELERWALERIVPCEPTEIPGPVHDLNSNSTTITVGTASVVVSAGGRVIRLEVLPLGFGLAWKVLDLLVELSVASEIGLKNERLPIFQKVALARKGMNAPGPIPTGPEWLTALRLYAGTAELRHALVHRKVQFDEESGTMTGYDSESTPLPPLPRSQQEAFCRLVYQMASAVCSGTLTDRMLADCAWQLDQLVTYHQGAHLDGRRIGRFVPLFILPRPNASGVCHIDPPALLEEAKGHWPTCTCVDVAIDCPDGTRLVGHLETAPTGQVEFHVAEPPSWLAPLHDGGPEPSCS